jgi:hypothetical protein
MGLRDIEFAEEYRSGESDALMAFLLPAFRVARRYDRAVGYFSSTALECFAEPFERFVQFGGSVRLVTSVELREQDEAVIRDGADRLAVSEERILEVIEREFSGRLSGTGLQKLAALFEIGRLASSTVTLAITSPSQVRRTRATRRSSTTTSASTCSLRGTHHRAPAASWITSKHFGTERHPVHSPSPSPRPPSEN